MKLIINKFPPITQKCEIDLSKKVTLFVGKNNSGKTYLSQLIWGINQFEINEYMNYLNITKSYITENRKSSKQEIDISNKKILDLISENYTKYFIETKKIQNIFKTKDIEIDFEILFDKLIFKSKVIQESLETSDWKMTLNKRRNAYKIHINIEYNPNIFEKDPILPIDFINKLIEGLIIKSYLVSNTTFMPSSRLFFPSFFKYILLGNGSLKNTMLDKFSKITNENKSFFKSSYTQPTEILLEKLVTNLESNQISLNIFTEKLEKLLEGTISVDKSEEISMADISYVHKSGKKLPMHLSSSMVNQLSMIYLYFKYWYKEDENYLILDEPEMNLHPAKQIEVIELLLEYASLNKLLIATHSTTVANSIINYIHLFDLKDKKDKNNLKEFIEENNLKINPNIDLTSNDIAIYYFNGSTVISYKDKDRSNIHFGTFTEVANIQTKQSVYIMDELE